MTQQMNLRVHHLNRSRSQRILWLLEEIEADYDIVYYTRDKTTNLAPPELANVHPLGKAPMMEIDGRLVVESAAICEIICARLAPAMIPPSDSDAHITHLELMHFAEGSVMTPILLGLYVGTLGDAGGPLLPRIKQQLDSHFSYMEKMLRPSGHYVQDSLSVADIMLSFPAEVAMRQNRAADFPQLAKFVEEMQGRPAYQRALVRGKAPD